MLRIPPPGTFANGRWSEAARRVTIGLPWFRDPAMTQHYIVGEFSLLLAGLQPVSDKLLGEAVGKLRHEIECSPLPILARLAGEAIALTDSICWVALEQGDASGFRRYADTAVALRELAA